MSADTITACAAAVEALSDDLDRLLAHMDADELALISTLDVIRRARQTLTGVERTVEDAAARAWPRDVKRLVLNEEWVAEVRYGKDRKAWQHEGLQSAVVAAALAGAVDTSTGEIIEPNLTTWAVRDALVGAANPSWRVTALKKMGIDPDDYCDTERGRNTVQIVPVEDHDD